MAIIQRRNVAYGITDALLNVPNFPIVAQRAPQTSDKAEVGTLWIDEPNNDGYILTSIVSNVATWIGIGGGSGSFTNIVASGTITAGGSITSGGTITAGAGGFTTDAGDYTSNSGNIDIGGSITATGDITAGGNITSVAGNLVVTAGTITASSTITSGSNLTFGATGVDIIAGTGNPVGSANKGSLYIRVDATTTVTRLWINTDGGTTWAFFTASA